MQIEVKIGALIMDPNSNTPIVVLKGVESDKILPIWVGNFEANAIALEIEKIVSPRPMTHDLIRNLIAETGLEVQKIIISDLLDNTFYAKIELLDKNGKIVLLDSRPSDAIALALRSDCPIFVEDKVFEMSGSATVDEPEFETDTAVVEDDWDEFIE